MQSQQKFSGSGSGSGEQSGAIVCAQCGAPMPPGMRFCRSCGHRLGEGPAEYTETVRLPNGMTAPNAQFSAQYAAGMGGPMARQYASGHLRRRRRLGFSGMAWLWIVLGVFFASGGGLSMLKLGRDPRSGPPAFKSASRSFVGVDELKTTDGGVTFDAVSPPGSPADKAGLVGGDIITSFDGQQITDDNQVMDLLRQTPVGKTAEVIYLRDGLTKKTLMTTISEDSLNQLKEIFNSRPDKGKFGFDPNRTTRISNPETKTFGVRIDWVDTNGPADLFGIKEGDIITDFDKIPIRTSAELRSRVRRAIPKSIVEVGLLRDGQPLKIPVTMGRDR